MLLGYQYCRSKLQMIRAAIKLMHLEDVTVRFGTCLTTNFILADYYDTIIKTRRDTIDLLIRSESPEKNQDIN